MHIIYSPYYREYVWIKKFLVMKHQNGLVNIDFAKGVKFGSRQMVCTVHIVKYASVVMIIIVYGWEPVLGRKIIDNSFYST